jgi:hypothetical protein
MLIVRNPNHNSQPLKKTQTSGQKLERRHKEKKTRKGEGGGKKMKEKRKKIGVGLDWRDLLRKG